MNSDNLECSSGKRTVPTLRWCTCDGPGSLGLGLSLPVINCPAMSVLSLNCWVVGDSPDEIFEIEIPRTKSVSVLKEIVKEKNANSLSNFDPKQLDLWKVYLPRDNLDTISSLKLENGTKLSPPIAKLSEFFDETVDQGLNIVVKMPPGASL